MSKKGWHLNALSDPPGLHIACTVSFLFLYFLTWGFAARREPARGLAQGGLLMSMAGIPSV